jgi:wyosine [tRNA(Phe)-imidazoG37] synthetase (radical SAM superfamily)
MLKLYQKFPNKNYHDKICLEPFETIQIDLGGNIFLCGCPGWMPTPVGNIFKNRLDEIIKSKMSRDIQTSVIDGSFSYCNEKVCGVIKNGQLIPKKNLGDQDHNKIKENLKKNNFVYPKRIFFSGDLTCNLSCPSCRTKIIKLSDSQMIARKKLILLLKDNLFFSPTDAEIYLYLSITGELFASELLLDMVSNIKVSDFPNLKLEIQTNGLLCKKRWHRLGELSNKVDLVLISIDAATKDTYEKLRRGGDWQTLMENLSWLKERKNKDNFRFITRMVVQDSNYAEMSSFYEFSKSYSADTVHYNRIDNWGTYTEEEFNSVDVFSINHPSRQLALKELEKIKKLKDIFIIGDM